MLEEANRQEGDIKGSDQGVTSARCDHHPSKLLINTAGFMETEHRRMLTNATIVCPCGASWFVIEESLT